MNSAAPDPARLAEGVERDLRAVGSSDRAAHEKAYLKSDLEFVGASVPAIRGVATALRREHPELPRPALFALVDRLWRRGVHDCRVAAVELLAASRAELDHTDLPLLERLVRESGTWALVDSLATNVIADIVHRHTEGGEVLDAWAEDGDFWVRRTALLAQLPALRRGEGDFARFAGYADRMLDEREFFIRKAIGWVLRDTARRRPELVRDWLAPRIGRVSGVTVREAVKHLPAADREALLTAYRKG